MPLRASINGKEIISTYLSRNEWSVLKSNIKLNHFEVIISQTNKKGYLRTSILGLQHFVHKKGEKPENWKPESRQHMLAKAEILLACKEAGWEAKSEYNENNWIADVIAIKESNRVAFEVQWSKQSYDKTKERQTKYKNDNVRGCWFFKTIPKQVRDYDKQIKAEKDLPIFKMFETENKEIWIDFYNRKFPIREFVKLLLNRKIKFCNKLVSKTEQRIEIFFPTMECWKCKTRQHVYVIQDTLDSHCDQPIEIHDTDCDYDSLKHDHQIHEAVNNFVKTEKGKFIKIGEIKERYSNTIKSSYMSFGCIKCDSLFGDFHIPDVNFYKFLNKKLFSIFTNININPITKEKPHWCFSKTQDFCE